VERQRCVLRHAHVLALVSRGPCWARILPPQTCRATAPGVHAAAPLWFAVARCPLPVACGREVCRHACVCRACLVCQRVHTCGLLLLAPRRSEVRCVRLSSCQPTRCGHGSARRAYWRQGRRAGGTLECGCCCCSVRTKNMWRLQQPQLPGGDRSRRVFGGPLELLRARALL
jgi:hypothetical protein